MNARTAVSVMHLTGPIVDTLSGIRYNRKDLLGPEKKDKP